MNQNSSQLSKNNDSFRDKNTATKLLVYENIGSVLVVFKNIVPSIKLMSKLYTAFNNSNYCYH